MEPRLTGHQVGRRHDWDWWTLRRLYVNLTLMLTFLLGLYLLLNWENVRLCTLSTVLTFRPGISATGNTSEDKFQGKVLPFVLGTVLVMMISILHVKFELPFWSFTPTVHQPKTKSVSSTPQGDAPEVVQQLSSYLDRSTSPSDKDAGTPNLDHLIHTDDVKDKNNNDFKDIIPIKEDDKNLSEKESSLMAFEKVFCTYAAMDEGRYQSDTKSCYERNITGADLALYSVNIRESGTGEDNKLKRIVDDSLAYTEDMATQTDKATKPAQLIVGTMTPKPQLSDASVNTHQTQFKHVKSCGTSTSGPFMKKLRRAQRLLKDAKTKAVSESRSKISQWRAVMCKYSERLTNLSDSNDKKDRLLGYTAFNRTLSENEVKEMYSTVRSARDRLQTQCKLNATLREVVESKCEVDDTVSQQNSHGSSK